MKVIPKLDDTRTIEKFMWLPKTLPLKGYHGAFTYERKLFVQGRIIQKYMIIGYRPSMNSATFQTKRKWVDQYFTQWY